MQYHQMKIFRTVIVARGLTGEQVARMRNRCAGLGFEPDGAMRTVWRQERYLSLGRWVWAPRAYGVQTYNLTRRVEFVRDHHIDGKTLARLLPAWAKPKKLPSIGAKVTAFYAENNKVICDRSALVVGSDAWYELQETLPDPFRATRRYMAEKYGRAYA